MSHEDFNYFTIHGNSEEGPVELHLTPDNTELYLHGEEFEMVDHIFHRYDPLERRLGAFIWQHTCEDEWEGIIEAIIESGNWIVNYRPVPTESDFQQYGRAILEVPDELPEDFS